MATPNIRKTEQFEAFLSIVKTRTYLPWIDIARILDVDKDTITEWKKTPQAQKCIIQGISHAVEKMEEAGKNDWRMWYAKLKLLGVGINSEKEQEEKNITVMFDSSLRLDK